MIRVRQVKVLAENKSLDNIKKATAKKLHIDETLIKNIIISKESIDARWKNEIYFVYEVDIDIPNESILLKRKGIDILKTPDLEYKITKFGEEKLTTRPIIIGAGPSGLFVSLILAENGFKPIIIEQGEEIDERVKTVNEFIKTNKLNKNSNVQFGEGGAGTFSDGKLNTLISDKENRGRKVFETFIECGADPEIMYSYKPHIGTDTLRLVIKNLRKKIESLGGEFRFNTKLTNILIDKDRVNAVELNNSEIVKTDLLVLAIGNSSRETFYLLNDLPINMESKPFAVGLRIMHPQSLIDESQFGKKYQDLLHPATYKLTYQAKSGRGVYTFCMCPGGYVINSSSEEERLVINGMSYHKRDSGVANSAIVVTVNKSDFGESTLAGLKFQEELEEKTYQACNGLIPICTVKDYYDNKLTTIEFDDLKIEGKYQAYNINNILPDYINESIKEALINMDRKIKNFKSDDAILAATETRTSSPIRITRNDSFESNIKGIYPAGEGAGYAGGITSSSIDGIKIAECIISKYKGENL